MPLYQALLGLAIALSAHPGHKAVEGHLHVFAAPSKGAPTEVEMGACVGERQTVPRNLNAPPPFDFKKETLPDQDKEVLAFLGYKFDDAAGRVAAPDGAVVMKARMEHLRAPFNAATEKLPAFIWMGFHQQNHRLDEKTCRILDAKGQAVRRLDVLIYHYWTDKQVELMAVQGLHADLAKLDPSKPLPPAMRDRIEQMKSAQLKLPPGLEQALSGARTAGDARLTLENVHEASLRFWDGMLAPEARELAAAPAVPAKTGPAYFDDVEARLGKVLTDDVRQLYGQYGPGQEMLGRFKELPRMVILKLSQRPDDAGYGSAGAVYDSSNDSVVFNHWAVASAALQAAPAAERAKLAKEFSDTRKLSAYLEKHPDVRQRFLESVDVMLYHELTHAWQSRRSKLDIEKSRGNLPIANPVEDEHEAYREMHRYFHAKLLKDPAKAAEDRHVNDYLSLLRDYNEYRGNVTQTYMQSFGATSDYPRIGVMQENRQSLFDRFLSAADNKLKQAGLKLGDEALKESEAESARRDKDFTDRVWPKMRREGAEALLAEYDRRDRPDKALWVAAQIKGAVSKERIASLEKATYEQLASMKGPAWDRVQRWESVEQAGIELPAEQEERRAVDYAQLTRDFIRSAKAAKTSRERRNMLMGARQYVNRAADKEKLLEEIGDAEARR